jgi:hypothetical protein
VYSIRNVMEKDCFAMSAIHYDTFILFLVNFKYSSYNK